MVACRVTAAELTAAAAASGEPTARAVAPGTTRLAMRVSTSPGPPSRNVSAPAAARACASSSQRTGETTCRPSSDPELGGVGDERAADVLRDRERGGPHLEPGERVEDRPDRRLHQGRVERPGDVQPHRADPALGRERLGSFDRGDRAADHRLRGRVLVRDQQHVVTARLLAEGLGVLGVGAEQRGHRAGPGLSGALHRVPAHDDDDAAPRRAASAPAATSAANSPSECPARRRSRRSDPRPPALGTRPHRTPAGRAGRTPSWRGAASSWAAGDDVAAHRLARLLEHRPAGRVRGPRVGHACELRALSREHHGGSTWLARAYRADRGRRRRGFAL